MSKMSQLHAELTEQAAELGFSSIEEAEANGYEVDYIKGKLLEPLDMAHEDYVRRKEELLEELRDLRDAYAGVERTESTLNKAINFIKEGEV